jgi:hypothetical protein
VSDTRAGARWAGKCPECGKDLPSGVVCNIHGTFCSSACIWAATERGHPLRKPKVGNLPDHLSERVTAWIKEAGKEPHELAWVAVPLDLAELLAHGAADIARLAAALKVARDYLADQCDHSEAFEVIEAALAAVRDGGR